MNDNDIILEYQEEKKKLKTKYIIIMIVMAIIVAIASSEFTLFYYNNAGKLQKGAAGQNSEENLAVISETLKSFRELIDKYYIGEIDEQKILDETIKGYVNRTR